MIPTDIQMTSGNVQAIEGLFKETKEEIKETKKGIDKIFWIQVFLLILTILMTIKMYFPNFLT